MKHYLIFFISVIITGCAVNSSRDIESEISNNYNKKNKKAEDVISDIIIASSNFTNPHNYTNNSKFSLSKIQLIPVKKPEEFSGKYAQALSLGGYIFDFGYLIMNDNLTRQIAYLKCININAKKLNVSKYINFSNFNNITSENIDSLTHLSKNIFFNDANQIRKDENNEIKISVLIGSWIEGLYIFNKLSINTPSNKVNLRIAEQKIIIDKLLILLKKQKTNDYYEYLINKIGNLKKCFNDIEISYLYKEPNVQVINGELLFINNSELVIELSKTQLRNLNNEINKLHQEIFEIQK